MKLRMCVTLIHFYYMKIGGIPAPSPTWPAPPPPHSAITITVSAPKTLYCKGVPN